MSSSFNGNIRFTIFGQSHSPAIGVTVEGLPAGFEPGMSELARFMQRRAPGRSEFSTPRSEADAPEFISGLFDGRLCGTPLTAMIKNTNTRSGDYSELKYKPRPGTPTSLPAKDTTTRRTTPAADIFPVASPLRFA